MVWSGCGFIYCCLIDSVVSYCLCDYICLGFDLGVCFVFVLCLYLCVFVGLLVWFLWHLRVYCCLDVRFATCSVFVYCWDCQEIACFVV